jgi:predicted dehydrogenase
VLKIGILGAAGIAPASIIRPAARRSDAIIAAVASRNAERGQRYAEAHGIPQSYDSYEALIADPGVDLVYVALPPSEHARWSIAALEHGKDVLCEKPIALNANEARSMVETASRTGHRLIEAFHDRYHPLSAAIDAVVESGRLGAIRTVKADFSVEIPFDPGSIRHAPELGGGALMDLGCYPVHWVRALAREEPTVVEANGHPNLLGTDESISALLAFPSGIRATVTASMAEGLPLSSTLVIQGELGTLEVNNLVFPSNGHSVRETVAELERPSTVAGLATYDHQLAAVVHALESGTPTLTEGDDIIGNMATIDAIYREAGFPPRP